MGEALTVQARISLAEQEGPGTAEIVLRWGTEREATPYQVGALRLDELSVFSGSSHSIVAGNDCTTGIGSITGTCSLSAIFDQPMPAGSYLLVTMRMIYDWVPEPGYEICQSVGGDPSCIEAGQPASLWIGGTDFGGDPMFGNQAQWTTLSIVGVRAIPEPTMATLLALGLGGLAIMRPGRRGSLFPQPPSGRNPQATRTRGRRSSAEPLSVTNAMLDV